MARDNRFERTRGLISDAPSPTQRSLLIERPVPEKAPSYTPSGLEALGAAISGFFRPGGPIDAIQDARHSIALAEIKRENEKQRLEAERKAILGEPLTEEEKQDRDYAETYSKILGERYGLELSQEFELYASQLPYTEDIDAHFEAWLQAKLKNGAGGFGTGDPLFDAYLLRTLSTHTDKVRMDHKEAALRAQLEKGRQDLIAVVSQNIDMMDATDLQEYFQDARELNPLDPSAAAGLVMNALKAAAGTNPRRISKVLTLLHTPGTGLNGQSFAESFPDGALDLEQAMTRQYESGLTWDGNLAYDDMARIAENINDVGILAEIIMPGGPLDQIRETYGKGGQYDAIRKAIMSKLEGLKEEILIDNQLLAMWHKQIPLDASLVRKHLGRFLAKNGVDPFESPESAGFIVSGFGVSSDDLRLEMSAALTDLNDPSRFAAALRYFQAIEQQRGEEFALSLMTEAARASYLYARDQARLTRLPAEDVMLSLKDARSGLEVARKTTWAEITGMSAADANDRVRKIIQDTAEDLFGEPVSFSEEMMALFMEHAKKNALSRTRSGNVDWERAIRDTVKAAKPGLSIYPGENGTLVAETTMIPSVRAKTDTMGNPVLDEKGRVIKEEVLGFGTYYNPSTGEMENLIEVFRSDARALANALPGVIEDLTGDTLSVDGRSAWGPKGVWLLKNDGDYMIFGLGQTYEIAGQRVTIPNDPTAAQNFLAELEVEILDPLPGDPIEKAVETSVTERLRFIPFPEDGSFGFVLGYVPGFKYRGLTLEEMEEQFRTQPLGRPEGFSASDVLHEQTMKGLKLRAE